MHAFGRKPAYQEKQHKPRENLQSPHRKGPGPRRIQTWNLLDVRRQNKPQPIIVIQFRYFNVYYSNYPPTFYNYISCVKDFVIYPDSATVYSSILLQFSHGCDLFTSTVFTESKLCGSCVTGALHSRLDFIIKDKAKKEA